MFCDYPSPSSYERNIEKERLERLMCWPLVIRLITANAVLAIRTGHRHRYR